jgi:hypothetical protein
MYGSRSSTQVTSGIDGVSSPKTSFDDPLEVSLDRHAQPLAQSLGGHDAVDRRVREHALGRQRGPLLLGHEVTELTDQKVRCVDGVLAGHDQQRGRDAPGPQPGADSGCDELQARWTDRCRDDVGLSDRGDDGPFVTQAVDRPVAVDTLLG